MRLTCVVTAKRLWIGIGAIAIVTVAMALLVAYSGVYNIAASRGHPAWLNWFLTVGMHRSVQVNSQNIKVPDIDDEKLAPLGAAHFHSGCAVCHGAPGMRINPVFDHMLPSPPNLSEEVSQWKKRELFWIVRHGLQYAGMPGWSGHAREDEVWPIVAFLSVLPDLSEQEYKTLSQGNNIKKFIHDDADIHPLTELLTNCRRCHGTSTRPATTSYVPVLGGQKPEYLARALHEYKMNLRESGYMEPAAHLLSESDIHALANHYGQLDEVIQETPDYSNKLIEAGRKLVENGDRSRRIPACAQCHIREHSSQFPVLDEQYEDYLKNQLILWQRGGRNHTSYGELMGVIAKRMTLKQIQAVSAYYASVSSRKNADTSINTNAHENSIQGTENL
ncbi:Cytochrome c-552 [Thalassocella blandensis]|nr:Cytochrome c-552 [Thalassocella blandensis]